MRKRRQRMTHPNMIRLAKIEAMQAAIVEMLDHTYLVHPDLRHKVKQVLDADMACLTLVKRGITG